MALYKAALVLLVARISTFCFGVAALKTFIYHPDHFSVPVSAFGYVGPTTLAIAVSLTTPGESISSRALLGGVILLLRAEIKKNLTPAEPLLKLSNLREPSDLSSSPQS
jgi:hypothetical protein